MDFDSELNRICFVDCEVDMEQLYGFVDMLKLAPNGRAAVPAIFRFFETNFDKDLGSPGPLVHFLEEENDYFKELEQSISRQPTDLTVWMVNRIINAVAGEEREYWLAVLAKAADHPRADSEAKESAREFIEYQRDQI